VIATVDDEAKMLAAYWRFDTEIKLYRLDLEEETYEE